MNYTPSIVCINLAVLMLFSSFYASAEKISISDSATYYDKKLIAPNIRKECVDLGKQFSDSTQKQLTKRKWNVTRSDETSESGYALELVIVNAVSAGNAFTGHKKSVSIEAKLFKDGELLDTYEGVRDSGGGFGAGFKSSCDVLQRCVNTLGKDVSKWLKRKKLVKK